MSVWLASYPRCGNTLLRQILRCCFDQWSYEGLGPITNSLPAGGDPDGTHARLQEVWGHRDSGMDAQAFYETASRSRKRFFVKTHEPPQDGQDAIYIVRDGRLALDSFSAYQAHYHPGESTFLSLLVGDHTFGSWSSHYRSWQQRSAGQTLIVRFEQLVNPTDGFLDRLANFLDYRGPIRNWINPQARLRQGLPEFFREGRTHWVPGAPWTEFHLRLFFALHGPAMVDLGYATQEEADRYANRAGCAEESLITFLREITARRWHLQRECNARLEVIHQLGEICAERLDLINRLTDECERGQQTCAERLTLINRLTGECEMRMQSRYNDPSVAAA
jgi:hypothetical protein